MRKRRWKRSDFTLIEVVVVIIILVTLASIATPLYLNYVKKANVGAAKTQIKLLEEALTGFRLDVGVIRTPQWGSVLWSRMSIRMPNGTALISSPQSRRTRGAMSIFMSSPASTANSIS